VKYTVDQLRNQGVKAGLVTMRVFRPFPTNTIIEALKDFPVLGVLDKSLSLGAPGGPLYEEVKTALYHLPEKPIVTNFIHGLGGRDTNPRYIRGIFENLLEIRDKGEVAEAVNYVGARL
jgi:pyruvate ferredoxin oxidoreductase alpha subunit